MVEAKKPVKPATVNTAAKSAAVPTATTTRSPLPASSPVTDAKPEATDVQPSASAAVSTAPEKAAAPASAPAEPTAAPTPASKPAEVLGKKIRTKGEIFAALRAGARVIHTPAGLYRIEAADGTKNATSKRRILSLMEQGILKASGEGGGRVYILDAEAERKAAEKKPAAKPEAPATAPATEEK